MPTMLRNRKTGELMPMNGDLARHDDMIPVEVPDMKKVDYVRGVAYLDEKHVFDSPDEDAPPEPEAPKRKPRKKAAAKAAPKGEDAVDLSDIELPDDDA